MNNTLTLRPHRDHRGRPGNGRDGAIQPGPQRSSLFRGVASHSGEGGLQETGTDQAGFGSPHGEGGASLHGGSRAHGDLLPVHRETERTDRHQRYVSGKVKWIVSPLQLIIFGVFFFLCVLRVLTSKKKKKHSHLRGAYNGNTLSCSSKDKNGQKCASLFFF